MIRAIRRWLNRNKPYVCRTCGFTVPIEGPRREQAGVAYDHWEKNHDDEREDTTDD